MMNHMGVPAPLCSWVWVRVNGEDWGMFLAIEEPEEAFAKRNFGNDYGQLYKPDYRKLSDENADVHLRPLRISEMKANSRRLTVYKALQPIFGHIWK